MERWVLIAAPIAAVVVTGCVSAPKAVDTAAAAAPDMVPYQPPTAMQPAPSPVQQSPSQPKTSQKHRIYLASHTQEANGNPRQLLFGPDAAIGDLIAYALANNPEIQAIHMRAHALAARVPQVEALDDPMLMTTAFLEPIQTAAGPQDVMLSISQKLPWFGKRALRGDVAYYETQATFARMAAAELAVVEQVKQAYFELYFLDRAVAVNTELETRLKDVIEIARVKYETASERTGLETVLQAQVELAELQTMLVQLEQAQEKAQARLAKALHAPPGASLELAPAIRDGNVPRSADVLVALIDQCQPNLEALRREASRDQAAIALAGRNYYPDVTLGFNWHAMGSTGLSAIATGDDAFSVMAGINLPIYQQKLDAGLREARFNAARTARTYDASWDELRAEVQTLHAEAVEHDRIVKILADEIVPRSEQTLDLSIEAYRVDRITFQQLVENYKTLLRHRLDYYRRLSQREQTLAALERAVGCAITAWPVEFEEISANASAVPGQI